MPLFNLKKKKPTSEIVSSRSMLLSDDSPFVITEAYKAMRTNLMYLKTEGACKKFAFTSALQGEGKSTNCTNTAIAFAQMGKQVLLIDADMRRPRAHRLFQKPLSPGLSDSLVGVSEGLVVHSSSYDNLSVLTAGRIPPNPTELLSSKQMRLTIEQLSKHFDYVFFDMPPLNVVTDAAVLADQLDGYVLVVRAESTPIENIKAAVLTLEKLNANIVGLLLNGAVAKGGSYKRGYKNGYYHTSYEYTASPEYERMPIAESEKQPKEEPEEE